MENSSRQPALAPCSGEESSFPELVAAIHLDRRPAICLGDPDDVWKGVDVAGLEPVRLDPHDRRLVVRCAVELVANPQKFAGEIVGDRRRFGFSFGLCAGGLSGAAGFGLRRAALSIQLHLLPVCQPCSSPSSIDAGNFAIA